MRNEQFRKVAAAAIVAAGFCVLALLYAMSMTDADAARRDFIGYWAAGQQIVRGASPYDTRAVLAMEAAVGLGAEQIKITPSPPAGLALVVPLGFLGAKAGLVFWTVLEIACLAVSIWIVWIVQGRPPTRVHLLGFLFAPALACIMAGQLGVFFLLGVALFLLWHEKHPLVAGAALFACALKPHLFLPVAVVLLLYCAWRRAWGILIGFAAGLLASNAIVWWFDPRIWTQYREMMMTEGVSNRFAPTLSAELRLHVGPHILWLQYLPMAVACAWAAWFFWKEREGWAWRDQGMLVLLAGILCAPYAWITDESVLLPAVLFGIYRAMAAKRSLIPLALAAAGALIELYANVRVTAWYYLWTTPAWLAWYLYATREHGDTVIAAH